MHRAIPLLLLVLAVVTIPAADQAASALETIAAANRARAALAEERAAWQAERERLEAILAATEVERGRQAQLASEASVEADAQQQALTALDQASDLDEIRRAVAAGAERLRQRMAEARATLPPGAVPALAAGDDGIDALDAVVAALTAAERGAGALSIDIVPGRLDGEERAVKLLRVAAAAAWWSALDGSEAGSARPIDGAIELSLAAEESDQAAIQQAIAIVEGRAPAAVLELPFQPLVAAAEAQP